MKVLFGLHASIAFSWRPARSLDRQGKRNARSKAMRLTFISQLAITAIGGNFV
jgi:hypothetical protein